MLIILVSVETCSQFTIYTKLMTNKIKKVESFVAAAKRWVLIECFSEIYGPINSFFAIHFIGPGPTVLVQINLNYISIIWWVLSFSLFSRRICNRSRSKHINGFSTYKMPQLLNNVVHTSKYHDYWLNHSFQPSATEEMDFNEILYPRQS